MTNSYSFLSSLYRRFSTPAVRRTRKLTGLELLESRTLLSGIAFQEKLVDAAPVNYAGDDFDLEQQGSSGALDLFIIEKDNGNNHTEISIYSGESNFATSLGTFETALGVTDANWEFDVLDWNNDDVQDLVAIHDSGTSSGYVEITVLDGASDFQSSQFFQTGFTTNADPTTWSWDLENWGGSSALDLVGIQKQQTGSGNIEIKVLDGADQGSGKFKSFLNAHVTTVMPAFEGVVNFDVDDFDRDGTDDLIIIHSEFPGGFSLVPTFFVYVLDGADNMQSLLFEGTANVDGVAGVNKLEMANWAGAGTRPELIHFGSHNDTGVSQLSILNGEGTQLGIDDTFRIKPRTPHSPALDYLGAGAIAIDTSGVNSNVPMNIQGLAGLKVTVEGTNNLDSQTTMSGVIDLKIEESSLSLTDGTSATGMITIVLVDGEIFVKDGAAIDSEAPLDLEGASVFTVDKTAAVSTLQIDVDSGSVLSVDGGQVTSSGTISATGTLLLADNGEVVGDVDVSGSLGGVGTIDGDVYASGTLEPGQVGISTADTPAERAAKAITAGEVGTLTMDSLTLQNSAHVMLEITSGLLHDQIVITNGLVQLGNATLSLDVQLLDQLPHDKITTIKLIDNQTQSPLNTIFGNVNYNSIITDGHILSTDFGGTGYVAFLNYSGGDGNDLTIDVGPFQVASTNTGVNGIGMITSASYTQGLSSSSVDASSITIHGGQGGRVLDPNNSVFTVNGSGVNFDLANQFLPGEQVSLSFTSGVASTLGKNARGQVGRFTIPTAESSGNYADTGVTFDDANDTVTADVNNDGFLDVVMTTSGGVSVFLNDGTGSFEQPFLGSTANVARLQAADFNGDGFIDLLATGSGSSADYILFNNGQGSFLLAASLDRPSGGTYGSVLDTAVGDVDGDGDIDIVLSVDASSGYLDDGAKLLLNDGNGSFTESNPSHDFLPDGFASNQTFLWSAVEFLDLDGDYDLDVIAYGRQSSNHQIVAWKNDGTGDFTEQYTELLVEDSDQGKLTVMDVNQDGHEDFVYAYREFVGLNHQIIHWNTVYSVGEGFYEDESAEVVIDWNMKLQLSDLQSADVDGDGDFDVFFGLYGSSFGNPDYGQILVYDYDQGFGTAPAKYGQDFTIGSLGLGDFNNDAILDIANAAHTSDGQLWYGVGVETPSSLPADLIGRAGNTWWVAQSNGTDGFTNHNFGAWESNAGWTDVQSGDFNNDGLTDVAGRNSSGQWWVGVNTGTSFNTELWGYWVPSANWTEVRAADVDGDGDTDIVGRTSNGDWWVARSNGSSFTNERWGRWSPNVTWSNVVVADVNGDGSEDIIGQTPNGQWWAARSNGTDGFTTELWGYFAAQANWQDVQVGDFNGDGNDDVVGRTGSGAWWVGLSNGSDRFTNQNWGGWAASAGWQDVMVADLNGDGNDDIIGRTSIGQWWAAESTGSSFTREYWGYWVPSLNWQDVRVIDVDQDGNHDLVGRASNGRLWVARSNGQNFTNQNWGYWSPSANWQDVMVGNVAGSGSSVQPIVDFDDDEEFWQWMA